MPHIAFAVDTGPLFIINYTVSPGVSGGTIPKSMLSCTICIGFAIGIARNRLSEVKNTILAMLGESARVGKKVN